MVRCPTCAGQVVVPMTDQEPAPLEPAPAPAPMNQPLFERSDFDQAFGGQVMDDQPSVIGGRVQAPTLAPPPAEAPVGAWGTHSEPGYDVEPLNAAAISRPLPLGSPPPGPGIFLSPGKATMITVIAVVVLAVAFGAGLVVGLMFH